MSLLQEALKRKERDETRRNPADANPVMPPVNTTAENPALPAPTPANDSKDTGLPQNLPAQSMPVPQIPKSDHQIIRSKQSVLWIIVAVIAVSVGLTIVAGIAFLYRHLPATQAKIGQAIRPDRTGAISSGTVDMVAVHPMIEDTQKIAREAEPTPPSVLPDAKKDAAISTASTQAVAPLQNTDIIPVQPQSPDDTERKAALVKPASGGKGTLSTLFRTAKWPTLKLTGILSGRNTAENTAFINGSMVRTGQTIDNVTVVEIQAGGVLLKYDSETKFLRVGATLY